MPNRTIPILAIVGWSKSGKTTFLEKLIRAAKEKGLKVGAVKHTHHSLENEDKDTQRLANAGADPVLLVSDKFLLVTKKTERELSLEKIVDDFLGDVDIVLAEGFKGSKFPKIEVYSEKEGALFKEDPYILAVVAKEKLDTDLPVFGPDDVERVLDFIIRKFSLAP
ncbi:MAG: molybdopterin-guanine dinucleotide biosynthesis protein B [Desulfobacterota bacterium]|nr:molybdopterin-guanine dinucleotide biosynthesis protein B [Thermodesulfobacteriota bacterium]MDW8002642.1 molybdopterin-guanine dinucleotide biosynthesis protein B [Deltaproteobacteria bacterium]